MFIFGKALKRIVLSNNKIHCKGTHNARHCHRAEHNQAQRSYHITRALKKLKRIGINRFAAFFPRNHEQKQSAYHQRTKRPRKRCINVLRQNVPQLTCRLCLLKILCGKRPTKSKSHGNTQAVETALNKLHYLPTVNHMLLAELAEHTLAVSQRMELLIENSNTYNPADSTCNSAACPQQDTENIAADKHQHKKLCHNHKVASPLLTASFTKTDLGHFSVVGVVRCVKNTITNLLKNGHERKKDNKIVPFVNNTAHCRKADAQKACAKSAPY